VKKRDALFVEEVTNTWEQLHKSGGSVAIVPAMMPGRQTRQCGWAVLRVNADGKQLVTDKHAAWYDHYKKTFSDFGRTRAAALLAAQAWVKEKGWYDGPWVRNRARDYVPELVNRRFPIRK